MVAGHEQGRVNSALELAKNAGFDAATSVPVSKLNGRKE